MTYNETLAERARRLLLNANQHPRIRRAHQIMAARGIGWDDAHAIALAEERGEASQLDAASVEAVLAALANELVASGAFTRSEADAFATTLREKLAASGPVLARDTAEATASGPTFDTKPEVTNDGFSRARGTPVFAGKVSPPRQQGSKIDAQVNRTIGEIQQCIGANVVQKAMRYCTTRPGGKSLSHGELHEAACKLLAQLRAAGGIIR